MLTSLVLAAAVAFSSPEAVVEQFCARYVKLGESYRLLETKESQALESMMSKRLVKKIADLRECRMDWYRQQPKNTTDKPPYVDCCLFSSIPDGMPRKYVMGPSETLADGRVKVLVDFTWSDARYSETWRDAYVVAKENGRWVIDDFLPRNETPLTEDYPECRNGKYVE